ncbi:MAG: UDP-N-acetylglucosamine 2-epimerase (hydrolyzing) [Firmicutes bacterium]|nr:UDP-N-acetylglucosamine 2-epimerase (hydrolyzing) [Bacillota bacterium]
MRKIAVVTGSRAEYGLLYPLLKRIQGCGEFHLDLIVTGMHLSPEFGLTYQQIEADGFTIAEKVEMLLSSDSEVGITKSIGLGVIGFADTLNRIKPDLIIILGDRFESFAAAISAFIARIPIAHVHGGEVTEGAIDDAIRHSITKMSSLHFVATAEYQRRVIQLGEEPDRVFNVGALGLDNIKNSTLLTKKELEDALDFKLTDETILVTFHPVTLENNTAASQFRELLLAIDCFPNLRVIFTRPNADPDGRVIIKLTDEYVRQNHNKAIAITSMGQQKYLSTLKYVSMVAGNSSSGIIEAPSFGIPTVNIGDRQKGRVRAESVINCLPYKESIVKAIKQAFDPGFRLKCQQVINPYGDGNAAVKIMEILQTKIELISNPKKKFFDIDFQM